VDPYSRPEFTPSDLSPSRRRVELDALVLDSARPVATVCALALGAYAIADAALPMPEGRASLSVLAGVGSLLLFVLRSALRRAKLSPSWGHPIVAGLAVVLIAFGGASFALSGEPQQTTLIALVVLASGMVLLSEAWLALVIGAAWAAWLTAWHLLPVFPEAPMHVATLATASMLTAAVHEMRVRSLHRMQSTRVFESHNRVQAERAVHEARQGEERFRKLAEATFETILLHDEREVMDANANFGETFGYEPSDAKGTDLLRFFAPESHELVLSRLALAEDTQYEAVGLRRDGVRVHVEIRTRPIPYEGKLVRVSAIRDVSRRKRRDAELSKTVAELRRSNQELEDFAYVASHDLRAPLRTIGSFAEILTADHAGHLDPEGREHLERIVQAVRRMERLLGDLLEYSRVGTRGKVFERVDLGGVLDTAASNLKAAAAESGAEVTWRNLPHVSGDEVQLVQLFQNLVGNAIKFRGAEPPRVVVSARRDDDRWELSVADNGIGIDPAHFDRIFNIFERLHPESAYAGTGIGLAICKRIVERHGGRISVVSAPGKGATFVFTLPAEHLRHTRAEDSVEAASKAPG
jgi:PAS domain S-box-containing protein